MYPTLTFDEARERFRRCRKSQMFICSEPGDAVCCHCKKKIVDDPAPRGYRGNRATYFPSHRKSIIMHYTCSWKNLLNDIFGVEQRTKTILY